MPKPTDLPALPKWASYETLGKDDPRGAKGDVKYQGASVCVLVDADAMYPALLEEYRERYAEGHPEVSKAELADLAQDDLCAYWLEVIYQTGKMDVQRTAGFAVRITIKHPSGDAGKDYWKQSNAPSGAKTAAHAAGGATGGKDARKHYKRLRGFLVA